MTSIAQIRFDYKRSPSERPDEYALRLVNRCVELERQCKEAEASASSEKTTMSSDVKYYDLRAAVLALYYSAYWHPDRPVDEAALWTAVRDAAGIAHGKTAEKLGSDRTADAAEIAKADYRAMGGGYSEGGA